MQAALPVEGLMRSHLARQIARALDAAALVGSGSPGSPPASRVSRHRRRHLGTNGAALTGAKLRTIIAIARPMRNADRHGVRAGLHASGRHGEGC